MAKKTGKVGKKGRVPAVAKDTELARLEKIFQLMQRNQVQELEWEKGGERLRLRCQGAPSDSSASSAMIAAFETQQIMRNAMTSLPGPGQTPAGPATAETGKAEVSKAVADTQRQITSPFVGTFYRSPSPTAEPYVREGQMVKRGDVLCIIEAMKLMNEIEAEASGRIVSVLVENGQPVEFSEPLFILEPAL